MDTDFQTLIVLAEVLVGSRAQSSARSVVLSVRRSSSMKWSRGRLGDRARWRGGRHGWLDVPLQPAVLGHLYGGCGSFAAPRLRHVHCPGAQAGQLRDGQDTSGSMQRLERRFSTCAGEGRDGSLCVDHQRDHDRVTKVHGRAAFDEDGNCLDEATETGLRGCGSSAGLPPRMTHAHGTSSNPWPAKGRSLDFLRLTSQVRLASCES